MMKWNRYLNGDRVLLRGVEAQDLDLLAEWRNAPENWQHFFNPRPVCRAGQAAWLEGVIKDPSRLFLVIVERASSTLIGSIGLDHIDSFNQSAEMGNVLIGNPQFRGAGLAREATELLLDLAFSRLNLRRIYLYVFAGNPAALRLYRSLGFEQEGLLKEACFSEGEFRDVLLMSLLKGGVSDA